MWFRQKKKKNKRHQRRHVLDVKQRSDHVRAVRVRAFVVMLGALLGTAFTVYVLWRSGQWALNQLVYENRAFSVRVLDVATDGQIPLEQLRRWSGVQSGQNLMALDLARVKSNLELLANIQSVSVERLLPGTVRIRVMERKPLARVYLPRLREGGGFVVQTWLLDLEGAVMMPLDPGNQPPTVESTAAVLPVLTGVSPTELRLGRAVESSRLLTALRLVDCFNHSGMATLVRLSSVDLSQQGVLVVMTEEGSQVTFGRGAFDTQLQRWQKIHEQGRRLNKAILTLDLAVRNNVPVRWVEADAVRSGRST